jgi:hypothetical protein
MRLRALDDILTYEPNTPVDIYGMAVGVKPGVCLSQKRLYGERLILGAKSVLLDLAKRGGAIRGTSAPSTEE